MPQHNELRVFISSTFRDLQEEREHLVKKVFPEIRALCRERGVTFTDVDLRWGLTEEEASLGRIIRTCLEEVDKCRPFFIGLIGSRYGWVPELHDVLMDPDLVAKYPFVEDLAIEGASVTEMEFVHGVFDAPDVDGDSAMFYHRRGDLDESDCDDRLLALLERARASDRPFREFTHVDELGESVRADLTAMIEMHWPDAEAPSELELQQRLHAAFAASRTRAYIPNPEYLKEFSAWISDATAPLVIVGESGLGKSSLVAYLVEYYRKKHPDSFVITHFVGASHASGTDVSVMRHIVEAIRTRFGIEEEMPSDPGELLKSLPNWLSRCGHLAGQQGVDVLIVVDAINQLDESGQSMQWLPESIPPGIDLVVSTAPGHAAAQLDARHWPSLRVLPLEDERVRQSIVVRYLGEFHKGVNTDQLRRVIANDKARSPLFLRVVAEELRLHGEHETLDEVVDRYTGATDLLDVFELVLARMEKDYGEHVVRDLLSLIAASRSGLSEEELLALVGTSRLELSRLLFAFDYHLLRRDGLLSFFHEYLRRAVEARYLADRDRVRAVHVRLAGHFAAHELTTRSAMELLWQYERSDQHASLADFLGRLDVLHVLYRGSAQWEVLRQWSRLRQSGVDVEAAYAQHLTEFVHRSGQRDQLETYVALGHLLERLGAWEMASTMYRRMLDDADRSRNPPEMARAERLLGSLLQKRGEQEEAERRLKHAIELYSALEDHRGLAAALGNLGNLYYGRQEYARALESHRRHLLLSQDTGSREGEALAYGNMGVVYCQMGQSALAIESHEMRLKISRELGDRQGVAHSYGNLGLVHFQQGEYDRALEKYSLDLEVCRELGDRHGEAIAVGNMGNVSLLRGQTEQALEHYATQLRISHDLGDRRGEARAQGGIASVHLSRGEYALALERYRVKLALCREIDDPMGEAGAHGNIGTLHYMLGDYPRAVESLETMANICRRLEDSRHESLALGNLGYVHMARGDFRRALEYLYLATEKQRALKYLYGLTSSLSGIGIVLVELLDAGGSMPEYLPEFVPGAAPADWRAACVNAARAHAEESISISERISRPDTLFGGRVLLARVFAADGDFNAALQRLHATLEGSTQDAARAELQYWLWKFGSRSGADRQAYERHGSEALRSYRQQYARSPKHEVKLRIDELTATTTPDSDHAAAE